MADVHSEITSIKVVCSESVKQQSRPHTENLHRFFPLLRPVSLSLSLLPTDVFFSISLALMVASLLETVFITNIQFSSGEYSVVPHWLSVLLLQYVAVLVCLAPPPSPKKKKSGRITVFLNPSTRGMLALRTRFSLLLR